MEKIRQIEDAYTTLDNDNFKVAQGSIISNVISRYAFKDDLFFSSIISNNIDNYLLFFNEWGIDITEIESSKFIKEERTILAPKEIKKEILKAFKFNDVEEIKLVHHYNTKNQLMVNYTVLSSNDNLNQKVIDNTEFSTFLQEKKLCYEELSEYDFDVMMEYKVKPKKEITTIEVDSSDFHVSDIWLYRKDVNAHFEQQDHLCVDENKNIKKIIENSSKFQDCTFEFILEYTPKTYFKLLGEESLDLKIPKIKFPTSAIEFSSIYLNHEPDSLLCLGCGNTEINCIGAGIWESICCEGVPPFIELEGWYDFSDDQRAYLYKLVLACNAPFK